MRPVFYLTTLVGILIETRLNLHLILGELTNVQILFGGILIRFFSFIHIGPVLFSLHLSLAII